MRVLREESDIAVFLGSLKKRGGGVSPEIEKSVKGILDDVRRRGDRALKRYTKKFDGHERLVIPPDEIQRHAKGAEQDVVSALKLSARRIRDFHERQRERTWSYSEGGIRLGQIIRPLERVGVYVPGGKASYPSTVLMNVIPAQVAGVREIAVAVPTPGGAINPYVMAAVNLLGIDEVYSVGGAQAVAAFACGTETIKRVDKVVGPGNIYVATAKRMVFGEVDIDMIAGPSEILIIADSSASPAFVAADMLGQAEHDELASAVLVTDSAALSEAVKREVESRLKGLGRKKIARKSIGKYGAIIITGDIDEAVEVSNAIAPEHLELMVRSPRRLLGGIKNAGAVFVGPWTPEPLGDYAAGPNHTLPTGGTARFSSPLGVYDFIKRTSLVEFSRRGFGSLADVVEKIASVEGLEAHAAAIRVRRGSNYK